MNDEPEGYKRAKAPKHDEYNPRPARPVGRPKVCQGCYASRHDIFDHICPRCLKDRRNLALLEREIAAVFPATARMTSAQIFRRIWKQNLKLSAKLKALRSKR